MCSSFLQLIADFTMEDIDKYYNDCLRSIFLANGLDESKIESKPISARDKTPLVYICRCPARNCVSRSSRLFKTKPLCDSCIPPRKRGPPPQDEAIFITLLEKNHYTVILNDEGKSGYVNDKSIVRIKNEKGEDGTTTHAHLKGDHVPKFEANKAMLLPIEEVRSRVEKAGFTWVEGTNYLGKGISFDIICHCGEISGIRLENIRENRIGCNKCYRYRRARPWSFIEGVADKYGCIVITPSSVYRGRETIIHILCACDQEMVKTVRNFLNAPRCSDCSANMRADTNIKNCGNANYLASVQGKIDTKNYWLDNYNVTHNKQVKSIQEKGENTCLKNHGVKCVLTTKEVREKAAKAFIENWGNTFGSVPEITEKMKATNRKRLGVDFPFQAEEIHNLIKKNNLINYGHEVFIQSEAGKALMTEKHGAPNAMQIPKFLSKARKTAFQMKIYTFPSGRIEDLQGYEPMCIDYLIHELCINEDDIVVSVEDVPQINYTVKGEKTVRRYFMDAYIKSEDRGIEVKSTWTYMKEQDKNRAKWIAASHVCKGGFDIYVFDKKCGLIIMKRIEKGEITMETITPFTSKLKVCMFEFY